MVKLGDLNVSKVAKQGLVKTQTGTPYYASPEVWKDKPYDARSDIWSLGCVLYEMTTLKPPFTAKDMKSLYVKVIRGYYPTIPRRYSEDLSDIIARCLKTNPSKRATAQKLIEAQELKDHVADVKDDSDQVAPNSPKTNLLNTIKLPKKLLDITKRLPKANYRSPEIAIKKKVLDIKIAKGLPDIFEQPRSQLSAKGSEKRYQTGDRSEITPKITNNLSLDAASNEVSLLLRNRLYKRIVKPESNATPSIGYEKKIRLPKIQRVGTNHHHNYSVNYSCRNLSGKRHLIR